MAQLSREAVGLLRRADVTLPAEGEGQVQTVQCSSAVQSCPTLCNPMDCSTPGFSVHHQLLELAHTHVHRVGDATNLSFCCPLLLRPSIFPRVFSNESPLCIIRPKYWSFSFNVSPYSEYSGLISFRMDWLDPLAVLLQHHSSKASILCCSAFSTGQLISVHDCWKNHSFD